jgi:hypothetical protein
MSLEKIRRLAARTSVDGERVAANAAAERLLERLRDDVAFCLSHKRMLRDREKRFLEELSRTRDPTPLECMKVASIRVAIENDPRSGAKTRPGFRPGY